MGGVDLTGIYRRCSFKQKSPVNDNELLKDSWSNGLG